jgi:Protein of unknown function (DUF3306)
MSDPEGFLARWSRLKRDAAEAADAQADAHARERSETPATEDAGESGAANKIDSATPSVTADVDLSKLPPIDAITASTDIRPFLAPGVPLELTRAALRRAWVADPNIRNFIGLAENQWDFNAPETIPGFGRLESAEEVRRLVAEVFGEASEPQPAETSGRDDAAPAPSSQPVAPSGESAECDDSKRTDAAVSDKQFVLADEAVPGASSDSPQTYQSDIATHNDSAERDYSEDHDDLTPPRPRRHGGALPD